MPDETININFKVTGADDVVKAHEAIAKAANEAAKAHDKHTKAAHDAGGPMDRIASLHERLSHALQGSLASRILDAHNTIADRLNSLHAAHAASGGHGTAGHGIGGHGGKGHEKLSPMEALTNLMKSSRLDIEGFQPSLGRLADTAEAFTGIEGLAAMAEGPIGVMVAAALASAKAFGELTDKVAESARAIGELQDALGSEPGTSALAGRIGAAAGLSPGQMGSLSASITQRIGPGGDPLAQAYAAQLGVFTLGRPFNVDEGTTSINIANALAKVTDDRERIRDARAIGAEALLPYASLSQHQRDYMTGDAATQTAVFDPKMLQNSLDFQDGINRVGDSLKNLLGSVTKPEMESLGKILDGTASGLDLLARVGNSPLVQSGIKTLFAPLELAGDILSSLDKNFDGTLKAPQDATAAALHANTQALMDNTKVLGNPGRYGHSERMGGALPAAYDFGSGIATKQMLAQGRGLRLGGFAA